MHRANLGVPMSGVNRRHSRRIRTRFLTLHSSGRDEGDGFLTDISDSGALVEEVASQPSIGNRVRLRVCLPDQAEFELIGQVVRHTESGFSVEFEKRYAFLRELIISSS